MNRRFPSDFFLPQKEQTGSLFVPVDRWWTTTVPDHPVRGN
jgi:hypothetical protein